jgi:DNA-binding transcriptional MerR regulator
MAGLGGGDARPFGGGNGRFTNDDVRQFTREFQELNRDAQQLRQQLQAAGVSPAELDGALRDFRQGENQQAYSDPKALEKLQQAALERLKQFEFNLRRKLDGGNESLALSGSDEVPAGFRQAIEEYYRSLAKKQATK